VLSGKQCAQAVASATHLSPAAQPALAAA